MKEPIQYFFDKYGFNKSDIVSFVKGEKYVGMLLQNGNIGVCSTLNQKINISIKLLNSPDFNNLEHRIILNAYYNAKLNYYNSYEKITDIFDAIDFSKYKNIVMIGFFRSLVTKFQNNNIPLTIFDKIENDPLLADMEQQGEYITNARCIILSGTTIFNKTFQDIVNLSNKNCDIFLLGPSNILNTDMFKYKNIKIVFGSIFKQNDTRVFELIKEGKGTPSFVEYLKKVYISHVNFKV